MRSIPSDERAAEIRVGEPFRDFGIGRVALIEMDRRVGSVECEVEVQVVVAALAVLQNDRQLRDVDVALLHVVGARHGAQVEHLEVLGERHDDLVDVGKLVTLGVDRVIEGIALHHPGRRVDRPHRAPRTDHRQLGIEVPVLLVVQHAQPVLESFRRARALTCASEEYFGRNCLR